MSKQKTAKARKQTLADSLGKATKHRHSGEGRNPVTDTLDIWTGALVKKATTGRGSNGKVSAHGIQKLRELILELAVRGRLVPQNSNDEPARVLLEKIAKEKARLIKEGKIKKQNKLPEISADEMPFNLPESWEWTRVGTIGFTQTGSTPKKANAHHYGNYIPFIKPADIVDGSIVSYDNAGLSMEGAEVLDRTAPSDSVLMVCIGTIGKSARVDRLVSFNQQINSVTPYAENGEYVAKVLQSPYFHRISKGLSSSTTIAILNKGKWERVPFALAPEKEQHRIVAKVDELMALCDRLEQQQTDSLATHQTLVETLLAAIAHPSADASAHAELVEAFDTLFTTEQSIDQLKQTILQLAVMGKLVPQDPNDEPASVLLEKIAKEKSRLMKEGRIKKQKKLPEITDDEKPFELPEGWEWSRLQDCYDVRDGTHDSPKPQTEGFPLVTSKNLYTKKLNLSDVKYITEEDHRKISERSKVDKGDILFAMIGSIGNPVIVDIDEEFSIKNVALFKYYDEDLSLPRYLQIHLEDAAIEMKKKAAGGVQSFISLGKLRNNVIALPPLAEQRRIVAKVDELMALCDTLKARLQDAQTTQVQLADAVVDQAVGQQA